MKEIVNDLLGFPGLKIIQRPDAFNFSLDSTLLADFVSIRPSDKQIIDLGCGNAPIPLLLSLKTKAKITGIEIQEKICDLARRGVALNNLDQQITILNMNIKEAHVHLGVSCFDVVVCNPPFFTVQEDGNLNKNDYLTIARHEVKITLLEVLHSARRLLKEKGTMALVQRSERLLDVLMGFREAGIEPKRLRFIYPKVNSTVSLSFLIEGKKSKNKGNLLVLPPLYVMDEQGGYTPEVLRIFNYGTGKKI